MRHRKKGRKLGRTWSHRKAMLRNMVTTFLEREQIETTDAKAKEVRSLAERLVTLAKRGPDDLAARRQALRVVRDKKVVAKLFEEIGPRYADRPGGYTRIIKVEDRKGDAATLSMLTFVTEPVELRERKKKNAWREGPLSLHGKTEEPEGAEEPADEAASEEAPESAEAGEAAEAVPEETEEKKPAKAEVPADEVPDEDESPEEPEEAPEEDEEKQEG
ncbi:MAG: 50S ribosomal protein L17 [Candidatus Eisenbacteria bacterium]|nr:50S ribosomal protein L17 [Candidatus Eisenbacteria bacterium]